MQLLITNLPSELTEEQRGACCSSTLTEIRSDFHQRQIRQRPSTFGGIPNWHRWPSTDSTVASSPSILTPWSRTNPSFAEGRSRVYPGYRCLSVWPINLVISNTERYRTTHSYSSRTINRSEVKYETTRKELLSVVNGLLQFRQYLLADTSLYKPTMLHFRGFTKHGTHAAVITLVDTNRTYTNTGVAEDMEMPTDWAEDQ